MTILHGQFHGNSFNRKNTSQAAPMQSTAVISSACLTINRLYVCCYPGKLIFPSVRQLPHFTCTMSGSFQDLL